MLASRISKEDSESRYQKLFEVFEEFLFSVGNDWTWREVAEELMSVRTEHSIYMVCKGFGMSVDDALEIVRTQSGLSEEDEAKRLVLLAAINNIVDFSVRAEYQMMQALPIINKEPSESQREKMLDIFDLYNKTYADVEDSDIFYSMGVAASLYLLAEDSILTYMTMGDERVRPSHQQYDGFSAPKRDFPEWLIPPIDFQCRCMLDVSAPTVLGAAISQPTKGDDFDPVFSESIAMGGRIFTDAHSYFNIDSMDEAWVVRVSQEIKNYWING